jgi:hypothetical protein
MAAQYVIMEQVEAKRRTEAYEASQRLERKLMSGSQCDTFEDYYPVGSTPRLVFALGIYTAQRRSDLVRLGDAMRRTDRASGLDYLSFTQVKNAARKPVEVAIPILPQLQQILDASDIGDEVYAIGGKGQAYTAKGIGGTFKRWTRAAGLPEECALH